MLETPAETGGCKPMPSELAQEGSVPIWAKRHRASFLT